jgi:UDP-glucose 4-epimerase
LQGDPAIDEIIGIARRVPPLLTARNTSFVAADIRHDDLVGHFRGADAVVHLAWFFQPTHHPMVTWENNVIGSERVFEAVAAAGVPAVVHASSVGAYSPGRGRVVDEHWPTHSEPGAGYGREKAYVERVLDRFESQHPDVRVVRMRPAFLFTHDAASEQRRIFAGPFVPNFVARRIPVLPYPRGLRFQALTTEDAARAYHAVLTSDVRGAFNLAAEPVIDGAALAAALGARLVELPVGMVRSALAAAWHLRLVPAEPNLLDLVYDLPELDASRARVELAWEPRGTSLDAVLEFVHGMAGGAGAPTAPLEPDGPGARVRELRSGFRRAAT